LNHKDAKKKVAQRLHFKICLCETFAFGTWWFNKIGTVLHVSTQTKHIIMTGERIQLIPEEERPRFTDQHTDDRIHEHLNNLHDEITEEDIRNVRTDIGVDAAPVAEKEPLIEKKEEELPQKEEVKDNTDPDVDTSSWNVLES
jgi:hypothetical protein